MLLLKFKPFLAFQIETGTKSSILTTTTRGETEANSQSLSTSTSASGITMHLRFSLNG